MSLRLLLRWRQRGAVRNLGAERAGGVLLEQLGQLLAHAIRYAAFNRLHSTPITTVEQLLDRCHTRRFALGLGGKPRQLSNRLRAVLARYFLDFRRHLVWRALLAACAWTPAATIWPTTAPTHLADFGRRFLKLEGGVKVADGAYLLEERGDLKRCRFREPGRGDLHADRKTVAALSERHRQGRHAGQAEGRSRTHHVER